MIELTTLFIPVAIVCAPPSFESCQLIQYQGYFFSKDTCELFISEKIKSVQPEQKYFINYWCVSLEIEKIDKKFIPKTI